MRLWKKGALDGAIWGALSLLLMFWWSQYLGNERLVDKIYIPNEGFKILLIRFIILPASISSKIALVPSAGVILFFPLVAILIGALIGSIIGLAIDKYRKS